MQNDFVAGALGSSEAVSIVPAVVKKVELYLAAGDDVVFTRDTHQTDYMQTTEGKYLPVPHCIEGEQGWEIIDELKPFAKHVINKPTFGSLKLVEYVKSGDFDEIELAGLCTDICVVSNALLLKANFPEKKYTIHADCCAGVTTDSHNAALTTMKMCHIEVVD